MKQDIEWRDIKSVYMCPSYLPEHPLATHFFLLRHSGFVKVDVSSSRDSHKMCLGILLHDFGVVPIHPKVRPFLSRWLDLCLVVHPLLTHDIQDYRLFTEHLEMVLRHEKLLSEFDDSQYINYVQDQFGFDLWEMCCLKNEQYFEGLIC